MSKEIVEDCKNCSGRGYHETRHTVIDPKNLVGIEVTTREECRVCKGEGLIIRKG